MAVKDAAQAAEAVVTGEELLAMGDIGPSELVEGRVVPMSPTGDEHAFVEVKFARHLDAFVSERRSGRVMSGEVGIYVARDPDTVRAADVAYISNERYVQRQHKRGYLDVAPELVVEILSPGDSMSDVMRKLREYFAIGVRLVWLADPEARTVLAYRSLTDVREFKAGDDLPGDDVLPGFRVAVARLFEE